MISKAQVIALAAGDWLRRRQFAPIPSGGGKSRLAAAIGLPPLENGQRALFTRITDLARNLQVTRRAPTSGPQSDCRSRFTDTENLDPTV
nr:hypothetical protein [Bradyrhizobium diazoefficiens]